MRRGAHPLVSGCGARAADHNLIHDLGMLRGATQLQLGALAPSLHPVDTRALDDSLPSKLSTLSGRLTRPPME